MPDIDVSKIVKEIGEPKARFIESEEEKKQKKMVFIFSFVFLFIFIAGTAVFFVFLNKAKIKAVDLKNEVVSLREENAQLLSIEKQAFAVRKRNRNALALIKNNANWSYVLEELEKVIHKDIVFTKLEVETLSSIKITGISPNYETLSLLITSLENSEMFKGVNLINASLNMKETGAIVEFVISLALAKDITRESFNPLVLPEEIMPESTAEEKSEEEVIEEESISQEEEEEGEGEEGEEEQQEEEATEELPVL